MQHVGLKTSDAAGHQGLTQALAYFVLTVLGFSFWFWMAVPLASHRESYWWLGMVQSQPFATAFSYISKTYRPLAQGTAWLGYVILDPNVFPTSVVRQTLLQGVIYGLFVAGWWLVYVRASQRRLFSTLAFVTGVVFFSGYVQLFHIYGIFYVPVMLILGIVLYLQASERFERREIWCAAAAMLFAFWHPFATALFGGFYVGFYLDTFRRRRKREHIQALSILGATMAVVAVLVVMFPTRTDDLPLNTRIAGFLVSYQTNELNPVASLVAFVLAQAVILSMDWPARKKTGACIVVAVLGAGFMLKGVPLLILWLCVVLVKLLVLRNWSLVMLTAAAALLPFGGGIGTPIYATFAICLAVYATQLGWVQAEKALIAIRTRHVIATIAAASMVVLLVRAGVEVPVVTRLGSRLLAERERTYQLENILAWLHRSDYCGYDVDFQVNAGNPIDSVESAMSRQNRPPASLEDVQLFWKAVLQCKNSGPSNDERATATVTFGGPPLAGWTPVFRVGGRYAGEAGVWVRGRQNTARKK